MASLQTGLCQLEAELYEIRHVKEDLDSLEVAYKLQLEEVLSASASLAQGQQNGIGSTEVVMLEVVQDLAQTRDLTTLQVCAQVEICLLLSQPAFLWCLLELKGHTRCGQQVCRAYQSLWKHFRTTSN